MKEIRYGLLVLAMLLSSLSSAEAQLSIGIGLPNVSIGINLPLYPELAPVPGYPVYYAPQVNGNYFFYDGMYWVYQDDNWYASSWYNGPWSFVEPTVVPVFVLRVPVRYYQQPPAYFRGWHSNAPPRWGQHWGHGWEQHRRGWDKWNRGSVPARAPQPAYQRKYSGDRYPQAEQQHHLRSEQYRYQPRDKVVRQHFKQQDPQRSPPHRQVTPAGRQPHQEPSPQQRGPATHEKRQQPGVQPHQQQAPRAHEQGQQKQNRGGAQEPDRARGQGHNNEANRGQGRNKDDDRGRGRDK